MSSRTISYDSLTIFRALAIMAAIWSAYTWENTGAAISLAISSTNIEVYRLLEVLASSPVVLLKPSIVGLVSEGYIDLDRYC